MSEHRFENKEIEQMIEHTVFNNKDEQGNSRFQREVHNAVFNGKDGRESRFQRELRAAFYGTIGKWLVGGGLLIIFSLANIYFQVNQNTRQLSEGGRYTEADAIEDLRIQEARDQRQDEEIRNLREEINGKLDQIINQLLSS